MRQSGIVPIVEVRKLMLWIEPDSHSKHIVGGTGGNFNFGSSDFQVSIRLYSLMAATVPGLLLGARAFRFMLYTQKRLWSFSIGGKNQPTKKTPKHKKAVMKGLDQPSAIQQSSGEFAVWVYTTKYTACNTIVSTPNFRPSAHMCD